MRLKAIELLGFKSFNNRSLLLFPPHGLSVIIGPNGCGKSNIVDAVLWALGEMRPTLLRSRYMEDVIFNGANDVKPSGMAEVSIILEDPEREGEIRITRRLYRSGESEYLLNRKPCRLKDIRDLLLGTGLGTNSYAIVPQGEIEALITAPPQQLRMLIEEAAGTSKVEERRKETLKKLEISKQNLQRLEDLLREVEHQANSLKYQASKAKRFKNLREQLRSLELREAAFRWQQASEKLKDIEDRQRDLQAELKGLRQKYDQLSEEVSEKERIARILRDEIEEKEKERLRLEGKRKGYSERLKGLENERLNILKSLQEKRRQLRDLRDTRLELVERKNWFLKEIENIEISLKSKGETLARIEEELSLLDPRRKELLTKRDTFRKKLIEVEGVKIRLRNSFKEAQERLSLGQRKAQRLKRELEEIAKRAGELEVQIKRKKAEREEILQALNEIEGALNSLLQKEKELGEELSKKRQELLVLSGEVNALKLQREMLAKMESDYAGYPEVLKKVLESPAAFGLSRAELLGDLLEVQKGYEKAVEAVLGDRIRALVARDMEEALRILEATGRKIPVLLLPCEDLGGEGELVRVTRIGKFHGLSSLLLGNVELVPELPRRPLPGREYVTSDGLYLDHRGVLWGNRSSGILERKNLLKEISKEIERLGEKWEALRKKVEEIDEESRGLKEQRQQLEDKRRRKEEALRENESLQRNLRGELEVLRKKEGALGVELEELAEESSYWERQLDEAKRELEGRETEERRVKEELSDVEEELQRLEKNLREFEGKRGLLKEELATLKERLKGKENSVRDIESRIHKLAKDEETLREENRRLERRQEEIEVERKCLEAMIEEIENREISLSRKIQRLREDFDALTGDIENLRNQLEGLQGLLKELEQELPDLRAQAEALRVEASHWEGILEDAFCVKPQEAVRLLKEHPLERDYVEKKERLKEDLQRLGEVNLGAIGEYERVKQRLEHLQSQKEDLEESIENLEKSLEEMKRRSREVFIETFERVREIFRGLVARLFEGGKGDLVLDGRSDPGIRIFIEPRGKRLRSMELLSRGEKCMASIAFILSLFFLKPAPFCIMDEVDSTLDEANIERFVGLLRELKERSQFILITHQRRTIEAAEYVYGVTMETPGISRVFSLRIQ